MCTKVVEVCVTLYVIEYFSRATVHHDHNNYTCPMFFWDIAKDFGVSQLTERI